MEVYYEFPPVAKNMTSKRYSWKDIAGITKPPLLDDDEITEEYRVFAEEAWGYTWICYIRLK